MLYSEGPHAHHTVAGAALVGVPRDDAVVHHGALGGVHPDVAGAVELRLDLADLGDDELIVINERVLAEGTARRGSRNHHLPAAWPERGRLTMVELADGDGLVLLDRGEGLHDVRGVARVVRGAGAVLRSPFRRRPLLVDGLVRHRSLQGLGGSGRGEGKQDRSEDGGADDGVPHGHLLFCWGERRGDFVRVPGGGPGTRGTSRTPSRAPLHRSPPPCGEDHVGVHDGRDAEGTECSTGGDVFFLENSLWLPIRSNTPNFPLALVVPGSSRAGDVGARILPPTEA